MECLLAADVNKVESAQEGQREAMELVRACQRAKDQQIWAKTRHRCRPENLGTKRKAQRKKQRRGGEWQGAGGGSLA
jgi:hypothetical protein